MAKGHLVDTSNAGGGGEGATREILVVDDNPADVRLLVEALNRSWVRYHINTVEDGNSALAFLQHRGEYVAAPRPALVLLDLNLPGKDGHEVLAEITANPELQNIPVMIVSTSSNEWDITRAYAAGAAHYFVKPMRWDAYLQLADAITAVGDLRNSSKERTRTSV